MDISVTTTLKRKTHNAAGKGRAGKTLCGKRIGEKCPTVSERPTCKVCAVVYDQKLRGVMRDLAVNTTNALEKEFVHGFGFFMIEFIEAFSDEHIPAVRQIIKEAGYEKEDFDQVFTDERDKQALYRIFTY